NKRRMVFRILYGTYDAEIAQLQQQLRDVAGELRLLEGQESASRLFLEGTPFANRAEIEHLLSQAASRRKALHDASIHAAKEAAENAAAQRLRVRVSELDADIAALALNAEREGESAGRLTELRNQLQTQSGRLTRAIVAGETFFDFDFRVCPRCGNEVAHGRV